MSEVGKGWSHRGNEVDDKIAVFKLHGSIDWIVAHRSESFPELELLFDKENVNRSDQNTGYVEKDCCLWRCRTREQLHDWIVGRDIQLLLKDASPRAMGIAGLGVYKPLHRIPGLGHVWARGMRVLYEADHAVVIGFSMSDFDAMAQLQFTEVARKRWSEGRPLNVTVIDPFIDETYKDRFRRVFRCVDFVNNYHEKIDWTIY